MAIKAGAGAALALRYNSCIPLMFVASAGSVGVFV